MNQLESFRGLPIDDESRPPETLAAALGDRLALQGESP
jgi:hypothetical protein